MDNMKHDNDILLLKTASMKFLIRNKEPNGGEKQKELPHTFENKQVKPSSPVLRISRGMSCYLFRKKQS